MFIVLTFKPKSVIYGINQQIKYIKVTIKKIFYVVTRSVTIYNFLLVGVWCLLDTRVGVCV